MKKIQNCNNSAVLVVLLLAGILLVMGAYRIFSYLCELPSMAGTVPILLAIAAAVLTAGGILLARAAFRSLKELQNEEKL